MFPKPIQQTSPATQVAFKGALVLSIVAWLLPLAAIMLTSVRSLADINAGNYWGMPTEWHLVENYTQVFRDTPMLRYFVNSIAVTVPAVLVTLLISAMAGYALAVYRFKASFLVFAMFIAGNFIPFQILMIPVRELTIELGMYDTVWALIFFHIAFQTGFCTFFLRGFIRELPFELVESARVEGVKEHLIFWKVMLPLIRPALAALAVLAFTFIWNDFFWAVCLVQSDAARPVTVGLQALRGQWVASWQLISAGSVVAALPPVAMFFLMQRHFIAGLTLGATKG